MTLHIDVDVLVAVDVFVVVDVPVIVLVIGFIAVGPIADRRAYSVFASSASDGVMRRSFRRRLSFSGEGGSGSFLFPFAASRLCRMSRFSRSEIIVLMWMPSSGMSMTCAPSGLRPARNQWEIGDVEQIPVP